MYNAKCIVYTEKLYLLVHYVIYFTILSSSDLSLSLGLCLCIKSASESFLFVVCGCISSIDTLLARSKEEAKTNCDMISSKDRDGKIEWEVEYPEQDN